MNRSRSRLVRVGIKTAKWLITLVVLIAIGVQLERVLRDFREQGSRFEFLVPWFILSMVLYLAGLTCQGVFFQRILLRGTTPVRLLPSIRAYLIGHLGKYVPGKAMVVVVRVGLIVPFGARASTAAIATFYETLVMMASGSLLALVGFLLSTPWNGLGLLASLGFLGLFLAIVIPPVFPRLTKWFSSPFPAVGTDAIPRIDGRLLLEGMVLGLVGWVLLGLSQIAVMATLGLGETSVKSWPLTLAGVSLATVTGFAVAVLPGGLGIREWVLLTTITPTHGRDVAVVSALLLRLSWLLAELLAAGTLIGLRARPSQSAATPDDQEPTAS